MRMQPANREGWEERAVRTRAVVAGLEQALEEEVRFDHRVAPAHSTPINNAHVHNRRQTKASCARTRSRRSYTPDPRQVKVIHAQDLSQQSVRVSHVEEGARAVEEHVLLDQVLARHGREHRTGLLGIEPEVVDEVA